MKKILLFFFILTLCCYGVLSGFLYLREKLVGKNTSLSPLPSFLNLSQNKQVTSLDLWFPSKAQAQETTSFFSTVTATSVISYDLTTNKILFAKSPNKQLPIASLTKIMAVIIALENPRKDDIYTVTQQDLVGEDSMGLDIGEKLSLKELLYGLILHSGNDAAETLATNFSLGRQGFIQAMNDKAGALGLTNTHFTNPTGLEGDGTQYSTAYDLLTITRYALLHFPLFDQVAATFDYDITATTTHKEYYLENETNLISSYPGVKGVKTGYTPEAGLCLVTYLEYGRHKIIAVILGSENRRQEMKDVLDYSLQTLHVTPPAHE